MRKFPFDDKSLIKLRRKSEKALMEWFWQVLVLVRLCWISKPAGMTCRRGNSGWISFGNKI